MLKFLSGFIGTLLLLYLLIVVLFYLFQERFIFFPQKLSEDTIFNYPYKFEEFFIEVEEGVKLHGLLFETEKRLSGTSKGLVLYFHGNAGALNSWGYAANDFLQQGYDVFIPDYRGYGKSEGKITSQEQLFNDVEQVYLQISKNYLDQRIIVVGFSIGSAPASWLASKHEPNKLILIAPLYNMTELARRYFLPSFILRYPLKNNQYLQQVEAPIILIHGKQDKIISDEASLKLKDQVAPDASLFLIDGVGHNDISSSSKFKKILQEVLAN